MKDPFKVESLGLSQKERLDLLDARKYYRNALISLPLMCISKLYRGENHQIINSYGNDICLVFILYSLLKSVNLNFQRINSDFLGKNSFKHNLIKAGAVFAVAGACEFLQKAGVYPGTYDSKDFFAYAGGLGLALGVDRLFFNRKGDLEKKLSQGVQYD